MLEPLGQSVRSVPPVRLEPLGPPDRREIPERQVPLVLQVRTAQLVPQERLVLLVL